MQSTRSQKTLACSRARAGDGQNEIPSFTDIDRSISGVSVKGSFWGRDTDSVGLGAAVNGISAAHRDFLAAGGLGLLIGDGRLNYRTENILEAYDACSIDKATTVTLDYQLIGNPAYNADRGRFRSSPPVFTPNFDYAVRCQQNVSWACSALGKNTHDFQRYAVEAHWSRSPHLNALATDLVDWSD